MMFTLVCYSWRTIGSGCCKQPHFGRAFLSRLLSAKRIWGLFSEEWSMPPIAKGKGRKVASHPGFDRFWFVVVVMTS